MNKTREKFRKLQAKELAFLKSATLEELEKVGCNIERKSCNKNKYKYGSVQNFVRLFD